MSAAYTRVFTVTVALLNEKGNILSHLRLAVSFVATRLSLGNRKQRLDEAVRVTTIETKDRILSGTKLKKKKNIIENLFREKG